MKTPKSGPPEVVLAELLDAARAEEPSSDEATLRALRDRLGDELLSTTVDDAILDATRRPHVGTPAGAPEGPTDAVGAPGKGSALKSLAVFAVGVGVGAAGHALVARPKPSVVYVDRPVVTTIEAPPAPASAPSTVEPAPRPAPSHERAPSTPTSSTSMRDAEFAAERLQIEVAQSALARGDADGALDAVHRYKERFPKGQLREESEVVAIQALVRAGRVSDARARAALYRARYPNGLFRPAVDEALRNAPSNDSDQKP